MTVQELKQSLVEVKEICVKSKRCCNCPLHKTEAVVYCPLNPYDETLGYPDAWDINDWKEGAK